MFLYRDRNRLHGLVRARAPCLDALECSWTDREGPRRRRTPGRRKLVRPGVRTSAAARKGLCIDFRDADGKPARLDLDDRLLRRVL